MKMNVTPYQVRMHLVVVTLSCLMVSLFIGCAQQQQPTRDYYQLKVYYLSSPEQMDRMDQYLEKAFIPAMHRAGIAKVGVFKPKVNMTDNPLQMWVWTPYQSLQQFADMEKVLLNDSKYQADGDDYINATHDNPPYDHIESILLYAFSEMPQFGNFTYDNPVKERIYELRSYESATEKKHQIKVDMFNSGEVQTFIEIGANPLFFGQVISGSTMPNLMYMTTYADSASHAETWNKFRTHPVWLDLKVMPKYENTVSKNTKFYLYPTEYSDI